MPRTLKNTIAVLVVTACTALAISATVQLADRAIGGTGIGAGTAAAYEITTASTGYADTSSGQLTCPRTGCTASYCHAAR